MKPELVILEALLASIKELNTVVKILSRDSCGKYIESNNGANLRLVDMHLAKADKLLKEEITKDKQTQDKFEKRVMGREFGFNNAESDLLKDMPKDMQKHLKQEKGKKDDKQKLSDKERIEEYNKEASSERYWAYDDKGDLLGWFNASSREDAEKQAKKLYPKHYKVSK